MRQLQLILCIGIGLIALSGSCNRNRAPEKTDLETIEKQYKEDMMEWNRSNLRLNEEIIKKYIKRRRWDMTRTGTGLYYGVYQEGTGPASEDGKTATVHYDMFLIDGTPLYSSDSIGTRSILLGHAESEIGLEEAVMKMQVGDKAHVIAPPHLAYGVPGDGNMIPGNAILVYDVELLKLED